MKILGSIALSATLLCGMSAYAQQPIPNAAPGTDSATQDSSAPAKPNMDAPNSSKPANATSKEQKKIDKENARAAKRAAQAEKANQSKPQ